MSGGLLGAPSGCLTPSSPAGGTLGSQRPGNATPLPNTLQNKEAKDELRNQRKVEIVTPAKTGLETRPG